MFNYSIGNQPPKQEPNENSVHATTQQERNTEYNQKKFDSIQLGEYAEFKSGNETLNGTIESKDPENLKVMIKVKNDLPSGGYSLGVDMENILDHYLLKE